MRYLNKKDAKLLGKLREDYLKFVYKKFIYNVLLVTELDKHEKMNQALAYVAKHKECLPKFMDSRKFKTQELDIMKQWEQEVYSEFHIIKVEKDGIELYDPLSDRVFYVKAFDRYMMETVAELPMEYKLHGSVFPYYGILVFDSVVNIEIQQDGTLEEAEEFYEHTLEVKREKGIFVTIDSSVPFTMPDRSSSENLSEVLYDFIAPFGTVDTLSVKQMKQVLVVAAKGWNLALVPDTGIAVEEQEKNLIDFFTERKKRYFGNIRTLIQSLSVYDDNGDIVVDLVAGDLIEKEE